MRVMITGSAGMLGSAVYPAFVEAGYEVVASDLAPRNVGDLPMSRLDVRDLSAVLRAAREIEPDLVVHLAAETDLETCELDPRSAFRTNTIGAQNAAISAEELGARLVYISTAGVFDGEKNDGPYTEFDQPRPLNAYGASKYEGERIAAQICRRSFIVRAGWMIGGGGRDHKFVAKILAQIAAGSSRIFAVDDKYGTPTYTRDFAANLIRLVETPRYGLYHMTCQGDGTRYDVAREVVAWTGRSAIKVEAVPSTHFADEYFAPRPRSEMMANFMLDLVGLDLMRPWRIALREYLDEAFG